MSFNLMLSSPKESETVSKATKTKEHYEAGANLVIATAAKKKLSLYCGIRTSNADEC
jgi:hypothetical protein